MASQVVSGLVSVAEELSGARILLVAQFGRTGGTRTYFEQLLRFYMERKADLVVAVDGPDAADDLLAQLVVQGIPYWNLADRVGTGSMGTIDRLSGGVSRARFGRELRTFRTVVDQEGIDLVVASVGHPGLLLGAVSAAPRGIYLLHTYPHGLRSSLLHPVKRYMLSRKTSFVTVSDFAAKVTARAWRMGDGSVARLYSTAGPVILTEETAHPLTPSVVTLGHVEPYKDPLTWIAVAEEVLREKPDVRFRWFGEGSQLDRCRGIVETRGLAGRVDFPGAIGDVDSVLSHATVYLQPSRVESLGLAVLDAARRGLPCVVSRVGGLPEVVADRQTGLIAAAGDVSGFAGAVGSLLADSGLAGRLGQAAKTRYQDTFTPEAWAGGLMDLHVRAMEDEPAER